MTQNVQPAHGSLIPFFWDWKINKNDCCYNLCFSYSLSSKNQIQRIVEALEKLVAVRAYLRQTFFLENNILYTKITDHQAADIIYHKIESAQCEKLISQLTASPHDLINGPLIKLNIIMFSDKADAVILFNIHHILLAANSLDEFIDDLNRTIVTEDVFEVSAEDYFSLCNAEVELEKDISKLNEPKYFQDINNVSSEFIYLSTKRQKCIHYDAILPNEIKKELEKFSVKHKLSIFNVLLIAWSCYLTKIYNQRKIFIDYPVDIRSNKKPPASFLNLVTMPFLRKKQDSFLDIIENFKDNLDIFKRLSKFDFRSMLDFKHNPLFSYSEFAQPNSLKLDGKNFIATPYSQIASSNINLRFCEKDNIYFFTLDLFEDLFSNCFVDTIIPRFFNLLSKLINNPKLKISSIDILFESERRKLLFDEVEINKSYLSDIAVHQLFEKQVISTPDNVAIVFEDAKITYRELNDKANQLASLIREQYHDVYKKVFANQTFVAIFINRGIDMVISILAVMKAGGAYVPLIPKFPINRINYILQDIGCEIIITEKKLQEEVEPITFPSHKIYLDDINYENFSKENLNLAIKPNHLVYIMYTSGTTGKPKGVMIEHQSVINTLAALKPIYDVKKQKRATAFTSFVFDVSVSEIFSLLIAGGELHILDKERKDPNLLAYYLQDKKINTAYLPPAVLGILPKIDYPDLRTIIYAGEPCAQDVGEYWCQRCNLYNYYGPTEATIYATSTRVFPGKVTNIGKPIANMCAYVLDNDYNLMPVGLPGELYLSGIGLARGYLNNLSETQERFVSSAKIFDNKYNRKLKTLYKTGDLVRYEENLTIEYLGRNDTQINMNGYRIEAGEIEHQLCCIFDIRQAYVTEVSLENHGKYLCAYYISNESISSDLLRKKLLLALPKYMVPEFFIHMKEFPLNQNGKIDKKSLEVPILEYSAITYVPPQNEYEYLIAKEFAAVLNTAQVSICADFFSVGGDSLKAISLVSRLQNNFKVEVDDIYELRTVRKIALKIPFSRNNLQYQLKNIINSYQIDKKDTFNKESVKKISNYKKSVPMNASTFRQKAISKVLLTGVTGYLGCNLLNQLLLRTNYTLFLLIRAVDVKEAWERVAAKYKFYFNKDLKPDKARIIIFTGDLEDHNLGLGEGQYATLVDNVDSIIHAAALTKHYGEHERFYSANVDATSNLLKLCALTQLKDFHYISTKSVFDEFSKSTNEFTVFTEDHFADTLSEQTNIYIKTKYEGEKQVVNYWKEGVLGNIYRVGNLAFIKDNFKIQENQSDNAFIHALKCFLMLESMPKELSLQEISPVDLTAEAIVRLFDKEIENNGIYHVFNPYKFDLADFFNQYKEFSVKIDTIKNFITRLMLFIQNEHYQEIVGRFLLHQGWLNENCYLMDKIDVLQDRSSEIMNQLGFKWSKISPDIFYSYLNRIVKENLSMAKLNFLYDEKDNGKIEGMNRFKSNEA
jgi:surfactin family lipopeptide synthetase A